MDPTTRPWHGPRKELGRLHEETALAADAQRRIEAVSVDVAGRRVAIARLDDTIMLVSGDAGALINVSGAEIIDADGASDDGPAGPGSTDAPTGGAPDPAGGDGGDAGDGSDIIDAEETPDGSDPATPDAVDAADPAADEASGTTTTGSPS